MKKVSTTGDAATAVTAAATATTGVTVDAAAVRGANAAPRSVVVDDNDAASVETLRRELAAGASSASVVTRDASQAMGKLLLQGWTM